MKIEFKDKTIISTDFSEFETAWKIEDAALLLEYFRSKDEIVLGGDILTEKLKHNYDSWYYNTKPLYSLQYNVKQSFKVAFEYISKYIETNGDKFYVIFVLKEMPLKPSQR